MTTANKRLALCATLILSACPAIVGLASQPQQTPKNQHFKGKVVPLDKLLQKAGIKMDADAATTWFALVGEDGKIYPLIKDDSSRMFFKDNRLLDRPMRLNARLYPESNLLQVIYVHSYVNGQLHDVYYWCDICSIRRHEKQLCDCCGDPMVFKEVPVK